MPRKMSLNVVPISLKVPLAMIEDAETALKNSPGFEVGMSITRTDILRIAMRRGLDAILAQQRKPIAGPRRKERKDRDHES